MATILTLLKTILSTSHNAPYSEELGEHWPAGQRFKLLGKRRQAGLKKHFRMAEDHIAVEQIGGEEVIVTIPAHEFGELFGGE